MNKKYLLIIIACLAIANISNATVISANFPRDFVYKNRPIDSYCFTLGSGDINLNNCGAESNGLKVTGIDQSLVHQGYIGAEYIDPSLDNGHAGFSYYKIISHIKNDYIIHLINNGGGSGTFASLLLVKRIADKINIITLKTGDRAHGGIDNVYVKNNSLYYTVNITPHELIALADLKLSLYQQLSDCMACYGAQIIYQRSIESTIGEEKLIAIDIKPPYYQPLSDTQQNVCFAQIVSQYTKKGKRYISWSEFQTFAQYYARCVKST